MITNNQLVQRVGLLILVVALMWAPAIAQAAPVQSDEAGGGTQWVPVDWFSAWTQIWDGVKAAFGMATQPEPPQPPETAAPLDPRAPGSTQTTLQSTSLDSSGEVRAGLDPIG